MGLTFRASGVTSDSERFIDLGITHNLTSLAKELGVYEAVWEGNLFTKESITSTKGSFDVWTVDDAQTALIEQAISRIESGDFCTPEPRNGWGSSQGFLKDLVALRDFCLGVDLVFCFFLSA